MSVNNKYDYAENHNEYEEKMIDNNNFFYACKTGDLKLAKINCATSKFDIIKLY
jgi:hypothetical protein